MKRWLGPGLVAVGLVITIIGAVGSLGGGDATAAVEPSPSSTTVAVSTTSAASSTTTTQDNGTSSSTTEPTTTMGPTTTTSSTTTTVPAETLEEFVLAYAAALEAGDRVFIFGRLHPATIDGWGEDLCSEWVDREIMSLSEYQLISVNEGPVTRVFTTPVESITIDDFYDATISFVFSGQTFEVGGAFALIGPEFSWLGQCR